MAPRRVVWAVSLAFVLGCVRPVSAADAPAPRTVAELEARVRDILKDTHTPGVGLALVMRDGTTWATGVGQADVASGRAATGDTLFRIGSVTKSFVSLAVLMLVEEGRLRLDDEVRRLVPEVEFHNPWESGDPVRVVHLLEHTAGFDDIALCEYALRAPDELGLLAGLAFHPATRTSRWRPGTRQSYCNAGPPVAAAIVEKLTGRRFEDFVAERIFTPLGMTSATFFRPAAVRAATLYRSDGVTPYAYWGLGLRPAGAVNASASEMARYVRFLLGRGTLEGVTLVRPESIARMEHPQTTLGARAGLATGYALGNYTTLSDDGFVWHGHNGGVEGGLANLQYLPEQGVGFAFMINSGDGDAFARLERLVKGFLVQGLAKPVPPPTVRVPEALRAAFAGFYLPGNPRVERLRFLTDLFGAQNASFEAGALELRPLLGARERYVAVSERLFRRDDRPAATLALIDDAAEGRLIQRGSTTFVPISAARFWTQTLVGAASLLLMTSAPLFALVWVPRALFRRLRGRPGLGGLRLRVVPLLSVLALVAVFALPVARIEDVFQSFGQVTPWSLGLCAATLAFALLSALGLWQTWRAPSPGTPRGVLWHARLVACANAVVALYLASAGVIGWRTWL